MNLQAIWDWLEAWPLSPAIRESEWMFPTVETFHVIAITLVVGTVMIVDLRVLGLASANREVTRVAKEILPWTWVMFVIAFISGGLMFAAKAGTYIVNFNFQLKMVLLLLAGLNMLVFHLLGYRNVAEWNRARPAPAVAKIACGLSIVLWVLIVVMGRWIGFTIEG